MEEQINNNNIVARPAIDKIMIVDDDKDWCFVSKMILQKAGIGKQVVTANNGREALMTLQTLNANGEKLPELIFLDIKMPVMDGFEFLSETSKLTHLDLSQTKIYICSSSLHPKDKEKAAQFPVAGFLTKPLTQEVLKEILI